MPRGKKPSHKGRSRHYTSPEELDRQLQEKDSWQQQREDKARALKEKKERGSDVESESEESEEEEEDEDLKPKGVSGLIEIENPNRVISKTKKASAVDVEADKPQLTRREREAIEKEQARVRYEKLHLEGKTDQAKADLARLAIIKKQREEAAKKKEDAKKAKDAAATSTSGNSQQRSDIVGEASQKAARGRRK